MAPLPKTSGGRVFMRYVLTVLVGAVAITICRPIQAATTETGAVRFNYGQCRSSSTWAGLPFFLDGAMRTGALARSSAFDGER